MYLEDCGVNLNLEKFEFNQLKKYWNNVLFEYAMKIFTWKNLPESLPEKELEARLYMFGMAGVNYIGRGKNKRLIVCDVSLNGVTDYYDEFSNYQWTTPEHSGTCKIGVNGVLIENNSLRNGIFNKINYYSTLLTHTILTYVAGCVNGRANTIIEAITSAGASSAQNLMRDIYNGKFAKVVNKGFSELRFTSVNSESVKQDYIKLYETMNNILANYLEEIGVKKANEKRERMIVDEVASNNNMLLLNMKDFYEARKEGARKINELFGTNIEVECNIDIDGNGTIEADEGVEEDGKLDAVSE